MCLSLSCLKTHTHTVFDSVIIYFSSSLSCTSFFMLISHLNGLIINTDIITKLYCGSLDEFPLGYISVFCLVPLKQIVKQYKILTWMTFSVNKSGVKRFSQEGTLTGFGDALVCSPAMWMLTCACADWSAQRRCVSYMGLIISRLILFNCLHYI